MLKQNVLPSLGRIAAGALLVQGAWMLGPTAVADMLANQSSVVVVAKQNGVSSEGRFKKFDAKVQFDAAKVAQASAKVDIDISSYDMGDAAYNQELLGKSWFNAKQFPKANFVSTSFKAGSAGRFDVAGKLTIKGKTMDVSFPMTVKTAGAQQTFEGVLPIKRTVFNIGEGEWKDTSLVADDVQIKFRVVNVK